MSYQIGTSIVALQNVGTLVGVDPRAQYNPGQARRDGLGQVQYVGSARVTWTFDVVTRAGYEALRNLLSDAYSGELYIVTIDDLQDEYTYRVTANLDAPLARDQRATGVWWRNVTCEFLVLEDVTP